MALDLDFNEGRYVKLLTNLIGETKFLQNNPEKFIPEENRYLSCYCRLTVLILLCRAIKHLLDVLEPYKKENGGFLKVDHVTYVEGRGNLIIEYDNVSVYIIYIATASHPIHVCALIIGIRY